MTEKELIGKLQELRQIKPQNEWVVFAKAQILTEKEAKRSLAPFGRFSEIFKIFQFKPVFATATAVMLLIVGIAGFFIFTNQEKQVEVAQIPTIVPDSTQEIILALEDLQKEINLATESLKEIKEPHKVLESRNTVVPFVATAREMIAEIEKLELEQNVDNKILALIKGVEKFDNAQKSAEARTANYLIQRWKTVTLTEAQQEVLKQAEQAYANRDYAQALINVMLVQQLIERK